MVVFKCMIPSDVISFPSKRLQREEYWYRELCTVSELVDSISRVDRGFPLTQYITNEGISRSRYTITHFKHHHCVLQLISNRMSV